MPTQTDDMSNEWRYETLAVYIGNIEDIVIVSSEEWAKVSMDRPIEFFCEMRSISVIYTKVRNIFVNILQTTPNDRRATKKSDEQKAKRDMVDLMMEVEDESGKKLDDGDIIDLILALSSAAYHSTSDVATWATIYLHQHPQVLQNAKEEQEEIFRKRPFTQKGLILKEIKQMEYHNKAIDETLRITNLPFMEIRVAIADANIKGYMVPKGWKVLIWNRGVHLDPENYPAPKEYNPPRWDNHIGKPGSFIPFGAGSRRCVGADIDRLGISIFLHYFLLNYKLEQLNPECLTEHLPQPRPSDSCLARVIKQISSDHPHLQ